LKHIVDPQQTAFVFWSSVLLKHGPIEAM